MHLSHQGLGLLAGALALIQVVPYVVSIHRGQTRPNRATYAIWSTINVVYLASYVAAGARATAWAMLAFTLSGLVVFVLSLRYGMGGLRRFDLVCLGLAATAIALWVWTKDPATAVYASLAASTLGFLPTIKKTRTRPETENALSWGLTVAAATVNLFALANQEPAIALPPFAAWIGDAVVFSLAVRGQSTEQISPNRDRGRPR